MRGLDPRIHRLREKLLRRGMDCRVKPGNDGRVDVLVNEMTDARSHLFPACSLQGCVQLQRVCSLRGHIFHHGDVVDWHHAAGCAVV